MNNILLKALILALFSSCLNCKTILHKRIEYRKVNDEDVWFYKDEPLEGTYKVRGNSLNRYSIRNYTKGKLNGKFETYKNGKRTEERYYLNNLLDGLIITYGKKNNILTKQRYAEGLPNGQLIELNNIGDTILSKTYVSTPYEMNVYVDSVDDISYAEKNSIFLIIAPCIIKSDIYYQRYYLKKDSALVYENVWERVNDCFHELIK